MYAPEPPIVPRMSGPEWSSHTAHRPYQYHTFGFVRSYFSNLCIALSSCFYFLCCCWVLEDRVGRVDHSDPLIGPEPGPAQGTLFG